MIGPKRVFDGIVAFIRAGLTRAFREGLPGGGRPTLAAR
jgi:hypothetical protein